jgi:hypothetical protein
MNRKAAKLSNVELAYWGHKCDVYMAIILDNCKRIRTEAALSIEPQTN